MNTEAQTLPRVGQVLWDFNNGTNSGSGGIAYAEDAGLVFGGTQNGLLFILDAESGRAVDTITTSDWGIGDVNDPYVGAMDISCSRDGSVVSLLVASVNGYKVVIMEYPSKRILKDSVTVGRDFPGSYDAWKLIRVKVSPLGRYVVTHDTTKSMSVPGRNQLRLYDLVQDTSHLIDGRSWARCDFDDAELKMAFLSSGSIDTALCGNRVSIATLGNGAPVIKHTQEYGWPAISGDGRYVMSCGYGVAMDLSPYPVADPRARVVEIETGNVIWSLTGDFSGGDNGVTGYDEFERPVWSRDASRLFCIRNSKKIPADWRDRIFYTATDTLPTHSLSDTCSYIGSYQTESAGSTSNSKLTIGFSNGGGIRAESLVPTTSSVAWSTIGGDGAVVYPNPMTGTITVRCPSNSVATAWRIYTSSGEEVASGVLMPSTSREEAAYTFNLPRTVRTGAYMLQLRSDDTPLCTRKVVVQ
ncbi:MAG: T9SS type A sorting domain-containing protein [Ignavibacteria bacterium]|nr:T9SS type A sorting domain-containing protein [Ignavibacteria bacterium]